MASTFVACADPISKLETKGAFRCRVPINGKLAWLLIDTGAEYSAIDIDAAQRIGLPVQRDDGVSFLITDAAGTTKRSRDFIADARFQLGAYSSRINRAPCYDMDQRFRGDGLLGMEAMRWFVFCFDPTRGEVHVTSGSAAERLVAERGMVVQARVPLGGESLRPFVTVRLEDQLDVSVLLDAGAESTSLPAEAIARLQLPSGRALAEQRSNEESRAIREALEQAGLVVQNVTTNSADGRSIGVHGVSTPATEPRHLRRLQLGDRVVEDLVVTEAVGDAAIGRDVLAKFVWLLHGPRRELWQLAPK